jgi:hypothetical protein
MEMSKDVRIFDTSGAINLPNFGMTNPPYGLLKDQGSGACAPDP